MAVYFGFCPECIFDPFLGYTSMVDSIIAKRIYRGCVETIIHKDTLVDLIELDMLDFNVILEWISFTRALLL